MIGMRSVSSRSRKAIPLKAIAELVENSIDAHAKTISITRGREHGEHYLTERTMATRSPRSERAA